MNTLIQLCMEFFRTGLFAVGGGLATLPFLTEISQLHNWYTQEMLTNMVAVSESTPGPIGVNMATYVGYTVSGLAGALCATLSLVLPSIIVIVLIARMMAKFSENRLVRHAFAGLHPTVTGLIASAGLSVIQTAVTNVSNGVFTVLWIPLILFLGLLAMMQVPAFKKLHPIAFITVGAFVGVLFQL